MSDADEPGRRADDAHGSSQPAHHPRIEVVGGGRISVQETAALTVAVAAHAAAAERSGPSGVDHAWARAARVEGTGRPRIDRPSDLDRFH